MSWSSRVVVAVVALNACTGVAPPGDDTAARVPIVRDVVVSPSAAVLTQHNDLARTGRQLAETVLTPTTVQTNFGRAYYLNVDARIYAQPLYVPNVTIGGTSYNVVYVATENNTVYAFDADHFRGNAYLWKANFGTYVPSGDVLPTGCMNIPERIGITGTPVIDPTTNATTPTPTMYFVAATKTNGVYAQTLYAIDIATGALRQSTGIAPSGFDPKKDNQRAGLALVGGKIYVAWSSHCSDAVDSHTYSGWVMSFNAANLAAAPSVLKTGPRDDTTHTGASVIHGGAGVWMGGGGPVSDGTSVWVTTGNGWFDNTVQQWGDTVLRLDASVTVQDFFTPYDYDSLYTGDLDMSAAGLVLLPAADFAIAGHAQLLAAANKAGTVYVLDAAALGRKQVGTSNTICTASSPANTCVLASTDLAVGAPSVANAQRNYGVPAYFNHSLYYVGVSDYLKKFTLSNNPVWPSQPTRATTQGSYGYPGATPSISASSATDPDAIVWTVDRTGDLGQQSSALSYLFANRADSLAQLYNSSTRFNGQDNPYHPTQFQAPTVAGGHVFIGGTTGASGASGADIGRLAVYGVEIDVPATATVVQGSSVGLTLSTEMLLASNVPRPSTLSATGAPTGATLSLSSATLAAGSPVTATFNAGTAAPGSYTITWTTVSSGQTYTATTAITVIAPPIASFTGHCAGWYCPFDATASTPGSGTITSYAWSFGDGTSDTGATLTHHYHASRQYSVTLTVTNSYGLTAATSSTVNPDDPPPAASFTYTCTGRACRFDATSSQDAGGGITQLNWNFGDSRTASGGVVDHTYGVDGNYPVQLTAVDTENQVTHLLKTAHAVDARPVASFTVSCQSARCTVDPSGSTDDLGIAIYALDWGDGTTGSTTVASTAVHTYAATGSYTIRLAVTDTGGQTTTSPSGVDVTLSLLASFTGSCGLLRARCTFDASSSFGPAAITNYHWLWVDGSTTDSATPTVATPTAAGNGTVTLTVSDATGATASVTGAPSSKSKLQR